jgi:hypothetical protein
MSPRAAARTATLRVSNPGGRQCHHELDHALIGAEHTRLSELAQHLERCRVLREHRSGEAADALLAGARGELAQQQRRHAPALPLIADGYCHLGYRRILLRSHEARHAHTVPRARVDRQQRLVVVMVDLGEVAHLGARQPRHG